MLARLVRDRRGNTLAIVGAAILPLLAMIGSGIDLSRTYMAHTRLQQACDAGALAGRRAMTNGTVDDTVRAEALKFFKFNFPTGEKDKDGTAWFGARGFEPVVGSAPNSTVTVTAATQMPLTVMKIFGFPYLPISVACNARLDFVNTDVVLVLDVTGSMADKASSTDTDIKIVALRKAVLNFYDTLRPIQTQLEGVNLRLRYAVVPYASSINVGRLLRGASVNNVTNTKWTYQSRQFAGSYRHSTYKTSSQCISLGGSRDWYGTCTWNDTNAASAGSGDTASPNWNYMPIEHDLSSYATGSSTQTSSVPGTAVLDPTRAPGTNTKVTWQGCIEERATTRMSSTATSIPTSAYDLDIDRVPSSGDITSQWKPYWPEVEYVPPTTNTSLGGEPQKPQWACPAEAKRLQVWAKSDLSNYLNTLQPDGGTYHDNGMVWGIRMLSAAGVFSADNPSTYGGMPVSKYLIFMTDGVFSTGYDTLYSTYGVERYDARATPGGSSSNQTDQLARHKNRFNLLCTLAKSRGISVWVVAFDAALDSSLSNCANKGQASTSANQQELNDKFVEIGKNIGALRLTQ
ncbi:pilus assembly protein [Sphingomonas jatrophae]|uniref:Putative Flp pilus-assembly TadE/G-like n=1 Tax=Sphingomonas jatrophae TaxID=1166337 RepID=A0A1I6JJB4_9SPHN|nr:Tad domain-containing protein [Sphingomonas jatrophae]SFR79032.1 Putative Flp pilus-assembly TadE/G-like [Sphingomonas jatrophae]